MSNLRGSPSQESWPTSGRKSYSLNGVLIMFRKLLSVAALTALFSLSLSNTDSEAGHRRRGYSNGGYGQSAHYGYGNQRYGYGNGGYSNRGYGYGGYGGYNNRGYSGVGISFGNRGYGYGNRGYGGFNYGGYYGY